MTRLFGERNIICCLKTRTAKGFGSYGTRHLTKRCSQPLADVMTRCGDIWDFLGWINLDPGETETRANPTTNRWYYYYAEAADGAFWAGPYVAEVSNAKFEKCTCLGVIVQNGEPTNPYYDVGFRELDCKTYSGVNFIP